MSWRDLKRGQRPGAAALNELADYAEGQLAASGAAVTKSAAWTSIDVPFQTRIHLRITDGPDEDGLYDWEQVYLNPTSMEWEAVADGLSGTPDSAPAVERNGNEAAEGEVYEAVLDDSWECYLFSSGGGGGGLTVEESDGSPSVAGVSTLRFDQATGASVVSVSAGVAEVELLAATTTQAGVVSLSAQTWLSNKVARAEPTGEAYEVGLQPDGVSSPAGAALSSSRGCLRVWREYVSGGTQHGEALLYDDRLLMYNGLADVQTSYRPLAVGDWKGAELTSHAPGLVTVPSLRVLMGVSGGASGLAEVYFTEGSGFTAAYAIERSSVRHRGDDGTFTTVDGKTVTVVGGLVVDIA